MSGKRWRAIIQCNYVCNRLGVVGLNQKLKLMSTHDIAHPLAKVKLIDYVCSFGNDHFVKKSFFRFCQNNAKRLMKYENI